MKKFIALFSLSFILVLLTSGVPKSSSGSDYQPISKIVLKNSFDPEAYYQRQCTFCHNTSGRKAPSMKQIKKIYLDTYQTGDVFIKKMSDFVLAPHKEKKIYQGDTGRFDVMPAGMFYDPEKIKSVVKYIYSTNEL